MKQNLYKKNLVIAKITALAVFVLWAAAVNAQITYTTTSTNAWATQVWSPAGTPGPTDNVIIAHNITANTAVAINNITVNAGRTLTLSNLNFTANGVSTINGTLTDNNAAGLNIFSGAVTINSTGTFSSSAVAANFEFANGITANGTLNIAAAAISLFRTNNQTISGTGATTSLGIVNIGSGITLTNNINTAGGLICLGNLNGTDAGSVLVNGAGALLQYRGATAPFATAGSLNAATNANTINYSGAALQA